MIGRVLGSSKSLYRNGKRLYQARSEATVEAILEASIHVLVKTGVGRFTTTRVAERAGVSVGTLYQYFPNKIALLHASLERHIESIATAVEDACLRCRGNTAATIAEELVGAFLSVMAKRADETQAVFALSLEPENAKIVSDLSRRLEFAVAELLTSATDVVFGDVDSVSFTINSAIAGVARAAIERGITPSALLMIDTQLRTMVHGYLTQFQKS